MLFCLKEAPMLNRFRIFLTRFELFLWLTSIAVVAVSYIAFQSGDMLSLIASIIGVTALIFVAKGHVLGQILTIVFAVFYGVISWAFRYYGEVITYLCMTAPMALLALITWLRNPYKDSSEVTVHHLTKKQWLWLSIAAILVTAAFYFILRAMGNAALIFSTLSITTSFLASGLTALRSPYYALAYAMNDLVLIVLWVIAALTDISSVPMVSCFVMFFANDMYGFINWRRMARRQRA